ncbi:MAG: hypothetical protein ABUT20_62185, partial [Bacteroidota bacterium]
LNNPSFLYRFEPSAWIQQNYPYNFRFSPPYTNGDYKTVPLNITELGSGPGDFISGSFSATLYYAPNSVFDSLPTMSRPFNVSGNFRARRN